MTTRIELKQIINELRTDVENARNDAGNSHSLQMKAEKALQDKRKESEGFSNQLSDIRKAIETVRRMKYPQNFIHSPPDDYIAMSEKHTDEIPVNEELNLLNYLQDLAQAPTQNEELRRYL